MIAATIMGFDQPEPLPEGAVRDCEVVLGGLQAGVVSELLPNLPGLFELVGGGLGLLGPDRKRAELVASPADPGCVAERGGCLEGDAERLHERDPAHEEREGAGESMGEAEGIGVASFPVEALERADERVGLLECGASVDPALRESGEEPEGSFDLPGHAFGLGKRLLGCADDLGRRRLAQGKRKLAGIDACRARSPGRRESPRERRSRTRSARSEYGP